MPSLRIQNADVRQGAVNLRKEKTNMDTILKNIQNAVAALDSDWQSPTSQEIRQNFANLTKVINTHAENIEKYAKFTDTTAEAYDTLETTMESNATKFRQ